MNQTAAFEEAVKTMENMRKAAEEGDAEAKSLLALFDASNPAAALVDISRFRPK